MDVRLRATLSNDMDLLKAPKLVLGIGLGIAVALSGWSFLSMYSMTDHSGQFEKPTRALLHAGVARDSQALARMDVSPTALRWVLDRSRTDPGLLKTLEAGLHASGSRHNHDRAEVTFDVKGLKQCGQWPLTVYFSGLPSAMRIEDVRTGCDSR